MKEYICFLDDFLEPGSCSNWHLFPLPWQLIAPKKAGKYLVLTAVYHVCTYVDKLEQKYMQKASINCPKSENGGRGSRQG
jgi:hypothetical protein